MPYKIGLTGGISSGKTTVSAFFAKKNIDIIDTDTIARQIVKCGSPTLYKIQQHFGNTSLTHSGELNRKKIRQIIFTDNHQKQWLEKLLHPLINQQAKQQLKLAKSAYVILSSPLLLETSQSKLVQRIAVVDSTEKQQIDRTIKRDQTNSKQVLTIMKTQLARQRRNQLADDIIDNTGSITQLHQQLELLHKLYCQLATVFFK